MYNLDGYLGLIPCVYVELTGMILIYSNKVNDTLEFSTYH